MRLSRTPIFGVIITRDRVRDRNADLRDRPPKLHRGPIGEGYVTRDRKFGLSLSLSRPPFKKGRDVIDSVIFVNRTTDQTIPIGHLKEGKDRD